MSKTICFKCSRIITFDEKDDMTKCLDCGTSMSFPILYCDPCCGENRDLWVVWCDDCYPRSHSIEHFRRLEKLILAIENSEPFDINGVSYSAYPVGCQIKGDFE